MEAEAVADARAAELETLKAEAAELKADLQAARAVAQRVLLACADKLFAKKDERSAAAISEATGHSVGELAPLLASMGVFTGDLEQSRFLYDMSSGRPSKQDPSELTWETGWRCMRSTQCEAG